jgi:hypothetical protein
MNLDKTRALAKAEAESTAPISERRVKLARACLALSECLQQINDNGARVIDDAQRELARLLEELGL